MQVDPLSRAGLVLGMGLGGFADGIVLHQILGWHHLICSTEHCEPRSMEHLQRQNVQDGFFHLAVRVVTRVAARIEQVLVNVLGNAAKYIPDGGRIGLPSLDGYEVASRVRRDRDRDLAGATLIAISGYGTEHDRRRSREAGFDHHLAKPVDLDTLFALIDAVPLCAAVGA